jgi:hypothetical protein
VEASSPAPDDLVVELQAGGDLLVVEPLGGRQDQLRSLDFPERPRVAGGPMAELAALVTTQLDLRGGLGHLGSDSPLEPGLLPP